MNGERRSAFEIARSSPHLPDPATIPASSWTLVDATRRLVAAVNEAELIAGGTADTARRAARRAVEDAIASLPPASAPGPVIGRHDDGRVENLGQAGSGRLNPQAPDLAFGPVPVPGERVAPVDVDATCTLSVTHQGPPGRAHGGVITTLLDEICGVAATAAGASGVTARLEVRYRAPTPIGTPLGLRARLDHVEGRAAHVDGTIRVGEMVTATARAVYVAGR